MERQAGAEKKIARVFPRKTKATPTDELAFTDFQPPFTLPEVEEIHISVAFTYDMRKAEAMYYQWGSVGVPTKIGGPAFNEPGGIFVPGMYLKKGYVITSRGCPNKCWFCSVPKREKHGLRELPVTEGYKVLDDNFLACSDGHIYKVFDMLSRQKERPVFTGGLEARRLMHWHAKLFKAVSTKRMYFAYDAPDEYEPLVQAGRILREAGFTPTSHSMCAYVLIGYPGDTFEKAEKRLNETIYAGFLPYAMLYRDEKGEIDPTWGKFQTYWLKPQFTSKRYNVIWKHKKD